MTEQIDSEAADVDAPVRIDPDTFPEDKRALYDGVHAALAALPVYFDFDNPIAGIDATDLHNLNTLMGAAIEVQVVETLNGIRSVWDPNRTWAEYSFVRSSQAFPDVRLARRTPQGFEVIFGIELKGWFLLAKEGVPSLRYKVAPAACSPWDLVCVVPWYLSNAVAGKPQVGAPWVEQARYAAEWRDHWWQNVRKPKNANDPTGVQVPADAAPYPSKADLVSVVPEKDGGDNFGRLPRCRPLMDTFIEDSLHQPILGIAATDWQTFLHIHSDNADGEAVLKKILAMDKTSKAQVEARAERLRGLLRDLATEFDFS
ncbi:hypothetical protein SAMN05443575_1476 [Jatrophihabitans endophyticus]|uniref:Uncharacterized protein n=1 Tax=Jatrophihabitans endophyticus TaxID=1206085 RepID=A0A1M5HCU6_9ACTN|nr:hypothetical protein [Jatrophihabitans endophyticus]SHG13708.1 hypothetical protein SAMN05443575_1476 [Jatrophihabitans endophyticus]